MAAQPVPSNPKLWNLLTSQARAKYPSAKTKGLSFPAAKFVRDEYARQGGGFVDSKSQVNPKLRDTKKEAEDKKKRQESDLKRKKKKQGFI